MESPIIEISTYDNLLSYLLKISQNRQIPVRYLLLKDLNKKDLDDFEIEDLLKIDIYSLSKCFLNYQFEQLNDHDQIATLLMLWRYLQQNTISVTTENILNEEGVGEFRIGLKDYLMVWLHTYPNFQKNPLVYDIFQEVEKMLEISLNFDSYNSLIEHYQKIWLVKFNTEYEDNMKMLEKLSSVQNRLEQLKNKDYSNIEITAKIFDITYTPEEAINPLIDIFNSIETSHIIPVVKYNKTLSGETDPQSYYKVFKGNVDGDEPGISNVNLLLKEISTPNTIYLNMWVGNETSSDQQNKEIASISDSKQFSLVKVSYVGGRVKILFNIPITKKMDEEQATKRFFSHVRYFDNIKQNELISRENKIMGVFYIYGVTVTTFLFLDFILNDQLFSEYFYSKDSYITSSEDKKNITLTYKSVNKDIDPEKLKNTSVSAILQDERLKKDDMIYIETTEGVYVPHQLSRAEFAQKIILTRPVPKRLFIQFRSILSKLLQRYDDQSRNLCQDYVDILYYPFQNVTCDYLCHQISTVSRYNDIIKPTLDSSGNPIYPRDKIKTLKEIAPEIFMEVSKLKPEQIPANEHIEEMYIRKKNLPVQQYYSVRCTQKEQPIIIREDEKETWEKIFEEEYKREQHNQKTTYLRTVQRFPIDSSKNYLFICPDRQYPVLVLIDYNYGLYDKAPCCRKIGTRGDDNIENYNRNTVKVKTANKSTYIIKTNKLLNDGTYGEVDSSILNFVKQYDTLRYTEIPDTYEIKHVLKRGFPRSINSFIHCVYYALHTFHYNQNKDNASLEDYISIIRKDLLNKVYPEVAKQELYDMTTDEIRKSVNDNQVYLDPYKYYRILEEYFNCNIYIFSDTKKLKSSGRDETYYLRLPRHSSFYSKVYTSRRTVLIDINFNSYDDSDIPQCDLIVGVTSSNVTNVYNDKIYQNITTFENFRNEVTGKQDSDWIYPAIQYIGRTLSWTFDGEFNTMCMDIFSKVNYRTIFGEIPVINQIIDSKGKTRMFILAPEKKIDSNQFTELKILVGVYPTEPLNVPEITVESVFQYVQFPHYSKILQLFGDEYTGVTTQSISEDLYITDLWYKMGDIQFAIHCPIQPVKITDMRIDGVKINPYISKYFVRFDHGKKQQIISYPDKMKIFEKSARFIDQLIKYLYTISKIKDVNDFAKSILRWDETDLPEIEYYNALTLPRILPKGDEVNEVLRTLKKNYGPLHFIKRYSPGKYSIGLINGDKNILSGIINRLNTFSVNISDNLIDRNTLRQLKDYYRIKSDFNYNPRTELIFTSNSQYSNWVDKFDSSVKNKNNRVIRTTLTEDTYNMREPFLFHRLNYSIYGASMNPQDEKFYIVQTVDGGDFSRAMNAAYIWKTSKFKRNIGKYVAEINDVYPYKVYNIQLDGTITISEDKTGDDDEYLEILRYPNNIYAALLPLNYY